MSGRAWQKTTGEACALPINERTAEYAIRIPQNSELANQTSMAVDYHGEIMIVPTDAGVGERTQVTSSPWRDRAESYAPDGRKIAFMSIRDFTPDEDLRRSARRQRMVECVVPE